MSDDARKAILRETANKFFEGLVKKDYGLMPYAPEASLRAPFCPGGVHAPVVGAAALEGIWTVIFPMIADVEIWDHYFNADLSAVIATAEVRTVDPPGARLRVADHFTVDAVGRITAQENHLDPRDVTNPGWRD